MHSASWPMKLVLIAVKYAPVYWTLHDCSSFLGTYYPSQSPLPTAKNLVDLDRFWKFIKSKNSLHSLSAIAPSYWMKQQAENSSWQDSSVETINYPIPDEYFKDIDQISILIYG